MSTATYPVRVDARLDDRLNRWLWLVKWILVIPHLLVLAVLWPVFVVLSMVAFFGILITGHYPRAIFDVNVGILRWTSRVQFYAYGALGTDRYPPFTLADVPDYPAHFDVAYPEHLSRGLVLVKWWLLAIPHYLVVGFFVGGGTWFAWHADRQQWAWGSGLIGLLVLVAGIVLAVTGSYPRPVFDIVLGMQRWVLRVAAYAALMIDEYPPFRFDQGGTDPGSATAVAPPPAAPSAPAAPSRWSGGRIVSVTIGSIAALAAAGAMIAGAVGLGFDRTQRDADGYLSTGSQTFRSAGYALVTEEVTINGMPTSMLGDARVRVTAEPGTALFVGVGRSAEVRGYLAGVGTTTVRSTGPAGVRYTEHAGGAPSTVPADALSWRAMTSGTGSQVVTWPVENGDWTLVVMRADGTAGLDVSADAGLTVPSLGWVSLTLLLAGAAVFVLGMTAVILAVPRSRVSAPRPPDTPRDAGPHD
jgi:hypothetical protein